MSEYDLRQELKYREKSLKVAKEALKTVESQKMHLAFELESAKARIRALESQVQLFESAAGAPAATQIAQQAMTMASRSSRPRDPSRCGTALEEGLRLA